MREKLIRKLRQKALSSFKFDCKCLNVKDVRIVLSDYDYVDVASIGFKEGTFGVYSTQDDFVPMTFFTENEIEKLYNALNLE